VCMRKISQIVFIVFILFGAVACRGEDKVEVGSLSVLIPGEASIEVVPNYDERTLDVKYRDLVSTFDNEGEIAGDFFDRFELLTESLSKREDAGEGEVLVQMDEKVFHYQGDGESGDESQMKVYFDDVAALFNSDVY